MTDRVSIDMREVDELVLDLGRTGREVTTQALAVVAKGAEMVKQYMQEDFSGHSHATRIPAAINYTLRGLSFEVGVDKAGPQGGLGNLLAFGSANNAPVVDHTAALRRELPAIEAHLMEAGVASLEPRTR